MHDDPVVPTRSREAISADNRAEIDAWIEERVAVLLARGMTGHDARAQALKEFGDVGAARDYGDAQDRAVERRNRLALWIEELASDLRIALRTLRRTPTVTAVVLMTFALGVGATTSVFSVVHAMLLRDLPYGDSDRLVHLPSVNNGVARPSGQLSAATLVTLRERVSSFSGVAGMGFGGFAITRSGEPELVSGAQLTANTFDVLDAHAAIGRTFVAGEDSAGDGAVAVLSHRVWHRMFGGDTSIVGQTFEFSGVSRRVLGVMPPEFRLPTMEETEIWVPLDLRPALRDVNRAQRFRFMRLIARVKPGTSLEVAQADVDRTMRSLQAEFPGSYAGLEARIMPVRTAVAGSARPRLLVLMGAAAFVLMIACANVAGILLSRAMARRHELSVRIALGAGRRRLIRQFLAEGIAVALLGGVTGVAVAQAAVVALRQIAANALPAGTTFTLEPQVLAFAFAVSVAGALLSSLAPALLATRIPGVALRSDSRTSPSRTNRRVRLALVAAQLAVSVVLLVGAGLFLRTLHRLSSLDLGYRPEQTLTFQVGLPRTRYPTNQLEDEFWTATYREIQAIPGVRFVGGGGNIPMGGTAGASLVIERRPYDGPRPPEIRYAVASDDYFAALGIPFIRGRAFNATDREGVPTVAIISEGTAKKFWGNDDPIGARIRLGPNPDEPWATIVGIVGDVYTGASDAPEPIAYLSQRQDHWRGGAVVARAEGDPRALLNAVRTAMKRVDASLPIVDLQTMEDFRRATPAIADRRLQMELMALFAIVALIVSAIGVYGVSAYAAEARRREFGIRIALGAPRHRVLWLALQDGTSVALIGAIVGIPVACLLASRIQNLLFATAPFDPLTIVAVVSAMIVVVLVATAIPARRAAMIDPARTIRMD